jgi:serine/threonine protein kinase
MSTAKPGCPSDEIFTRLVEGLLPEDETRALEAHCDRCLTCARLLAELARSISPSGGAGSGLLGDRYRLLEPLGAGGMGVVYAAFDTKLSRKVAVKRLRETSLGTPAEKRRGRFMREAQLLASLSHPNVLTIHDVGGADRELYVVMELVDGAPVSRWLSETRPGWRAIVEVFQQAGRGVVAAHQLGIVHRDIKPDNILVAKNGRVLVGDFGLAGLAGNLTPAADPPPPSPSPASLTQTGTVLGTPAYMSPEQHDGKPGDALSDQFSFAVSLYESLHGRRPFAGRSASEIAAATRSGQLAPGGDGVPRAIDRVLSTALEPDPGRRYSSMEDLLAALERAHERRPAAAWVAGAVVLLAAGALTARVWTHHVPPPTPPTTIAAKTTSSPPAQKEKQERAEAQRPEQKDLKISDPSVSPRLPPDHADSGPTSPKHRRQLAQADAPIPAQGPVAGDPKVILDRAGALADKRDGKGCLTALAGLRDVPADLAARAQELRGDCEMLAGNCEAGRKILEPMYQADRRHTPATAEGLLSARIGRMCPVSSFPTVQKRLTAIYLQAVLAMESRTEQSRLCGALARTLLADTQSKEVQDCFPNMDTVPCRFMKFDLANAYERVTDCLLRDKNCREGARMDVMRSQVGWGAIAVDHQRINLFCRPSRVVEVYPACTAEGEAAERKCLDHVDAARRAGDANVTPLYPR